MVNVANAAIPACRTVVSHREAGITACRTEMFNWILSELDCIVWLVIVTVRRHVQALLGRTCVGLCWTNIHNVIKCILVLH